MSQETASKCVLDLRSIRFPSDGVTLAQMRHHQPEILFDNEKLLDVHVTKTHLEAIEMLRTEHVLARQAWMKAAGLPNPHPLNTRSAEVVYLNDFYVRYGVSLGIEQTKELVRTIEREASKLAKQSVGRGGQE